MVKISETAKYNRSALLALYAESQDDKKLHKAMQLEWPGENYNLAAYAVWYAMRNRAIRDRAERMNGNNNRPGYILMNITSTQIIALLWPDVPNADCARVHQAIGQHLKRSENAVTLEKATQIGGPSKWWIADEWDDSNYKPRRYTTRKPGELAVTGAVDVAVTETLSAEVERVNDPSPENVMDAMSIEPEPKQPDPDVKPSVTLPGGSTLYDKTLRLAAEVKRLEQSAVHCAELEAKVLALELDKRDLEERLRVISKAIRGL